MLGQDGNKMIASTNMRFSLHEMEGKFLTLISQYAVPGRPLWTKTEKVRLISSILISCATF